MEGEVYLTQQQHAGQVTQPPSLSAPSLSLLASPTSVLLRPFCDVHPSSLMRNKRDSTSDYLREDSRSAIA
jgi:hypothetical protein